MILLNPHRRATIAERLTKIREDRGLTRDKVASDLNLALTTIAGYEQGYRVPKFDNLLKLANYYRVTLEYLVGEEDEENPPAKENVLEDAILEDFIMRVRDLCNKVELDSREKRNELDLLVDFLEMRINKKLNK